MEQAVNILDKKIAFIGGGNMAEAIIKGLLSQRIFPADSISVGNRTEERCRYWERVYGVRAFTDNGKAVAGADVIVLAVKPQVAPNVFTEQLASYIDSNACIISIMGSVTLSQLEAYFSKRSIIRTMPNTPLAVGEGVTAIAQGAGASEEDLLCAEKIFSCCGITERVDENQLEAVTALSGCGPGYAFVIIDALADAGVRAGLPRQLAIRLAAQTLAGSGKLCLTSGLHPAQLRDQVTSPGGTTIAGIHALEAHGIRGAFFDAVQAVINRNRELQSK